MNIKTIRLTSLLVNTENYRFEPQSSQKEAIDRMIEDQNEKLYVLAVDIIKNGLSPVDLIMVTPDENNARYIVLEGNRRITTLKILSNPSLISDDYDSLRRRFQKLSKENNLFTLKSVACAVFETAEEANIWIKRKHAGEQGGIGTVTWNAQQKDRFEERVGGKTSTSLQIIALLQKSESVPQSVKAQLSYLNTTNLQRLIADKYVREKLGLELNNGLLVSKIAQQEVVKGLTSIVKDILSPEFKVADIYNSEKRRDYINSRKKNDLPDLTNEANNSWQISTQGETDSPSAGETAITQKRGKTSSKGTATRRTLIPHSFAVEINEESAKINKIFSELKSIPVGINPNAASVLFRVFLELSVDRYIDSYGLVKGNALSACSSNENLNGKVQKVLNHMRNNLKVIDDTLSKGIRAELSDLNSILSVESLNAYVHNPFFYPKADNLIIGWDNTAKFFSIIWDCINKAKQ